MNCVIAPQFTVPREPSGTAYEVVVDGDQSDLRPQAVQQAKCGGVLTWCDPFQPMRHGEGSGRLDVGDLVGGHLVSGVPEIAADIAGRLSNKQRHYRRGVEVCDQRR